MPRKYPPEAKKTAFELYLTGMPLEEVVQRMRVEHGYASYSVETLRRWRDAGDWDTARDKLRAQAAERKLDTSLEGLEDSLLEDLLAYKQKISDSLEDGNQAANFTENMGLLLRVHGLIEKTLARRAGAAPVDKVALAGEVLDLLVKTLAEKDPASMEIIHPHIPALGAMLKARYAELA